MIGHSSIATLAGYAVVVDAKGEQAQAFYEHFGFIELPGAKKVFVLSGRGDNVIGAPGLSKSADGTKMKVPKARVEGRLNQFVILYEDRVPIEP